MVRAVEFDHQSTIRVVQVGTSQEFTTCVAQIGLNCRIRQPRLPQQHAESCLHRRLGSRFRQRGRAPQSFDAFRARMIADEGRELVEANDASADGHLDSDDGLYEVARTSKVTCGPESRRSTKAANRGDLGFGHRGASDSEPGAASNRERSIDRDFDRFARRHVEAMQPPRRSTGKREARRHAARNCFECQARIAHEFGERVLTAAHANEPSILQRLPGDPGLTGLGDEEWALQQHVLGFDRCAHDTTLALNRSLGQPSLLRERATLPVGDSRDYRPFGRLTRGDRRD